jgi:hypothetical protein
MTKAERHAQGFVRVFTDSSAGSTVGTAFFHCSNLPAKRSLARAMPVMVMLDSGCSRNRRGPAPSSAIVSTTFTLPKYAEVAAASATRSIDRHCSRRMRNWSLSPLNQFIRLNPEHADIVFDQALAHTRESRVGNAQRDASIHACRLHAEGPQPTPY